MNKKICLVPNIVPFQRYFKFIFGFLRNDVRDKSIIFYDQIIKKNFLKGDV